MQGVNEYGIVHLHGREYKTVARRVQDFRTDYPISSGWAIKTNPVEITDKFVIFRAAIVSPEGVEVAIGYSEEVRSAKGINSMSALENAETSAIGRALAAAGYGGSEYASANEVEQAIAQQKENEKPAGKDGTDRFYGSMEGIGYDRATLDAFAVSKNWQPFDTWTVAQQRRFFSDAKEGKVPGLPNPKPTPR